MTRYYLGIKVTAEPADSEGWAWATWPDGRRFRHWAPQLRVTPWGDLGVLDAQGDLVKRGPIEWTVDILGGKSWRGLHRGDRVYLDDILVFEADDLETRLIAG